MAVSFQCMTKFTTNKKIKNKKIKIKKELIKRKINQWKWMERDFHCPSTMHSANCLWIKKKSYLQTANQYNDIKKVKN